jgi:DNA-binding transcriptional ArsR family regulator
MGLVFGLGHVVLGASPAAGRAARSALRLHREVAGQPNAHDARLQETGRGLDALLHEGGRLAIVSVLAAVESLTFTELRDALDMTDGNLSVHLRKLEEKGYVAIDKQFVGRRPQTTCRLTKEGQKAFAVYLDHLEAIVRQGRGQAGA